MGRRTDPRRTYATTRVPPHHVWIAYSSGSQPFSFEGPFILFWRAWGPQCHIFTFPPTPFSPLPPTARGSGERCKFPQRGLGRSPSQHRILEHSMEKSDRFDRLRDIFQRSKKLEIFRFPQKFVIFTITGIAAHTLPAYPVKMGSFAVGGLGPLFKAWRATFGPRATGWEPLAYRIYETAVDNIKLSSISIIPQFHYY